MLLVIVTGPLHAATAAADSLARPQRPWTGMAVGAGMLATSAIARQAYPDVPADIAAGKTPTAEPTGCNMPHWPLLDTQSHRSADPLGLGSHGRVARHSHNAYGRLGQDTQRDRQLHPSRRFRHPLVSLGPHRLGIYGCHHDGPRAGRRLTMVCRRAYAVATGIAVERAVDRHHYPTDIVAGAGIGILSAQLGYWLGDIIFGDRNLDIRAEGLRLNTNVSYLSSRQALPSARPRQSR